MQYINHWPDMAELLLPEPVTQDLQLQLLEPFDGEASAKYYWMQFNKVQMGDVHSPHNLFNSVFFTTIRPDNTQKTH